MRITKVEKDKKSIKYIKIFKNIWKIIENLIFAIILLISLIILIQRFSNNTKAFLGYRIFRVETGSMIPKYKIGDVLLVKEKDTQNIQVGEDLVYLGKEKSMKGKIITHQIINKEQKDGKTYFYTKGIANNSIDPIVSEEQVNGIVKQKMLITTFICNLLNNRFIFYFIFIVPLTVYIFFSYIHYQEKKYIGKINNRKKGEK